MIIAVTGGKGGTGKTVFAINLALAFKKLGYKVKYLDCDADCPSSSFVGGYDLEDRKEVHSFIPSINQDKCMRCGSCVDTCRFNALLQMPGKVPVLEDSMCIGCSACMLACSTGAITESSKVVGYTYHSNKYGMNFFSGSLLPSEILSEKVVDSVKERAGESGPGITIVDTAAGAHCSVVRALEGADIGIVITEPTEFGKHDYEVICEVLAKLGIPRKIVLNRFDISDMDMEASLKMAYSSTMMECYVQKTPIILAYPDHEISKSILSFAKELMK